MEASTFRKWLEARGCRFEPGPEGRGQGHAVLTVRREGKTAQLPLVGSRQALDFATEQAICEALALDWSQLPGAQRQP